MHPSGSSSRSRSSRRRRARSRRSPTRRTSSGPTDSRRGPGDFDRLAADYDRLRPADGNWRAVADAIWEDGDLGGRTVLDVGCGTGRLAETLSRRGARVWGVDPSEAMLERAGARLGREARLKQGHAESLPFPDGSFERVVLWLVLQHLDRRRALSELARVLVPSGRLVIASFAPAHFERIWLAGLFPSLPAIDGARFPDAGTLRPELERAGFERVRVRELSLISSVEREEALEKLRGRYISTLWLLDEDEYRAGLERAERELAPVVRSPVDWQIVVAERR